MEKIKKIFEILLSSYGCQKWWPTTLEGGIHPSYHGKKHSEKQKFEIAVGAILTQNTAWKNVEKAIEGLNKKGMLEIEKLKKAKTENLAEIIRPSGYFNQKAERLKIIADFFSKNKNPSRNELLGVKGIGPETADSILLYALEKPFFVVDAYTKRIFSRIGLCRQDAGYDEVQAMFHSALPKNVKIYNEYHALIVELAKMHCRKKPECRGCPISKLCKSAKA